MIKLTKIEISGPAVIALHFNDGSHGNWSAQDILARQTVLTKPLEEAAYFQRAFIEASALAWPNGLEFSAGSLHAELDRAGLLRNSVAA